MAAHVKYLELSTIFCLQVQEKPWCICSIIHGTSAGEKIHQGINEEKLENYFYCKRFNFQLVPLSMQSRLQYQAEQAKFMLNVDNLCNLTVDKINLFC